MQRQAVAAEQTSRSRYWQSASLPPREIELTVRLLIPEDEGADVGIRFSGVPSLPPAWDDLLFQRLSAGVHRGLASVGTPLPTEGIGIDITHLAMLPRLDAGNDTDDVDSLGDALEALTAATVAALWSGLMSLAAASAAWVGTSPIQAQRWPRRHRHRCGSSCLGIGVEREDSGIDSVHGSDGTT